MNLSTKSLTAISNYYSGKLAQHGETALGVDWNGEKSQFNRFEQLSRIIRFENFSINDIGCGYGAFIDYLDKYHPFFSYEGCDISDAMVKAGRARYAHREQIHFINGFKPSRIADYSIASGIFNAHQNINPKEWQNYIETTVDMLHETSGEGFAFNCLTTYSDKEKLRTDLYYSDPCFWFDRCKNRYSRQVTLLHDYDLFEFTILVRKK